MIDFIETLTNGVLTLFTDSIGNYLWIIATIFFITQVYRWLLAPLFGHTTRGSDSIKKNKQKEEE